MIKLSKSCLSKSVKKEVNRVLDTEYLGMGVETQNFEIDLSKYFNNNVVCVSNGTAALQLALQSIGIKKGDEVLVQSLTYVATWQAITATGGIPIACEVDIRTGTLDVKDFEKKITKKTKAVVPVHYAGGVGNL